MPFWMYFKMLRDNVEHKQMSRFHSVSEHVRHYMTGKTEIKCLNNQYYNGGHFHPNTRILGVNNDWMVNNINLSYLSFVDFCYI